MRIELSQEELDRVHEVQQKVEEHSRVIDDIVYDIIQPYCKGLDKYVDFIRECLKDGTNPATDEELEDWCLNLSTLIYFAGGMCEQLGIRDDISRSVYKEIYHTARSSQNKGTVQDKDSLAELASQEEQLVNICYNRAYKTMKAKIENAQELMSSCKKSLSRRMQEMELTRLGGNQ